MCVCVCAWKAFFNWIKIFFWFSEFPLSLIIKEFIYFNIKMIYIIKNKTSLVNVKERKYHYH